VCTSKLRRSWGFSKVKMRKGLDDRPRPGMSTIPAMRLPLWLKIAWTAWVLLWAPVYGRQYGLQNFLFFCDLGNLFIAAGLWLESPLLFSSQACGLLVFQTLYCVDLAGALATGRHPIGGTEYMFDPQIALWIRLLSLFHVATPPMLLWAIQKLGYDRRGWKCQTLLTWVVIPINYFWRPQADVNCAGMVVSGELSDCGSAGDLLADGSGARVVDEAGEIEPRSAQRFTGWDGQGRPSSMINHAGEDVRPPSSLCIYFVAVARAAWVASSKAPGPTGLPVACTIHRSGVTRPMVAMRSNSGPIAPALRICSSI